MLAIHRASPGELPQEPYEEAESEEDRGFRQLVGRLELRGPDRKAFLPVVMEGVLEVEAMLDTAAGVTLMSQGLFQRLRAQAERAGKRLNTAPCTVSLQPYAEGKTVVENVAVVELSMGPVSMAHPVYVSPIAAPELLIGQDCLLRLDPLMDLKRLELWMQTRRPKPVECWPEGAHVTEVGVESAPPIEACQSFLCAVSSLAKDDFPKVLGPVVVGGTAIDGVGLALWADRSAINQGILEAVQANRPGGVFTPRVVQYRDASRGPCQGIGLWSAKVVWSGRTLRHTFVVVRGLAYPLQVGCDLLVKMGVVVDSINNVLWALTWPEEGSQEVESDSVKSRSSGRAAHYFQRGAGPWARECGHGGPGEARAGSVRLPSILSSLALVQQEGVVSPGHAAGKANGPDHGGGGVQRWQQEPHRGRRYRGGVGHWH